MVQKLSDNSYYIHYSNLAINTENDLITFIANVAEQAKSVAKNSQLLYFVKEVNN